MLSPHAEATRPVRRLQAGNLAILLVLLAFPVLLYLWRRSLNTPFFALSGDDFHRTLYAWEATQGRWLPSDLWPPLQFWLEALVLQVYPNLLAVPALINICAATGALACLALLARTLTLDRRFTLVALLLAASIPWFVWLSLSGLPEPLFFCGVLLGFLGVARWRQHGQERWLWLAAAGLLAAGMVRFDAWGDSVVFTLAVAWLCWRSARPRPWRWLAAAALPWLFPLFWLGYQYSLHGSPFYFLSVTRNYFLAIYGAWPTLTERLLWQPRDLLMIGGPIVPLGFAGVWLARRQPAVGLLALMWLASLGLLIQTTLSYTITNNNPVRLIIIHVVLLTPFAVLALQRLATYGWTPSIVVLVLTAVLVAGRVAAIPAYPNALADDVRDVGSHIGELRSQGLLQPGDSILVEVRFWEYLLIQLLSGDPAAAIFDRRPQMVIRDGQRLLDDVANPSLLASPPEQLRAALDQRSIRIVVTYTDRATQNMVPIARETMHSGRFRVYMLER
jgi:hypothetical protein